MRVRQKKGVDKGFCLTDTENVKAAAIKRVGQRREEMRVWIYANDWTKVNVPNDGKPIHFGAYHAHDEGWSSEATTLWIEEDALHVEYCGDGRDCDGRMSTYMHCVAPIDGGIVRTEPCETAPGGRRIAWGRVDESRRDYSAEAMGY